MFNAAGELSSAFAIIVAAFFAACVAAIGHWVNRDNAKFQGSIALDSSRNTNIQVRENAKLNARLTSKLKLVEMRQSWINGLRDDLAAFQAIGVTPDVEHANEREFYRLGTRIELFMNPNDIDFPELKRCLYAFLEAESTLEKYSANPAFVSVCQRILKREWEVLKAEMRAFDENLPETSDLAIGSSNPPPWYYRPAR